MITLNDYLYSGNTVLNNVIVPFKLGEKAKVYYKHPVACNCISYGNNRVVSATDEVSDILKEYTEKYSFYHCFENPNMYWLNEKLAQKDLRFTLWRSIIFRMPER
ncbi:MAG: hypothetical protein K5776_09255 [Lachnospiraceae bacterium]|nr:hypothetical protein [Lachnospiraceae bacterium]